MVEIWSSAPDVPRISDGAADLGVAAEHVPPSVRAQRSVSRHVRTPSPCGQAKPRRLAKTSRKPLVGGEVEELDAVAQARHRGAARSRR